MTSNPASRLQATLKPGENKGVNPSLTDSATYHFDDAISMAACFKGELPGAYLYNRHWNPTNQHLARALAALENTEACWVTASGMSAITNTLLHFCSSGDHIISSSTTYGGTYAFMKNYLPKFNISTSFVDVDDLDTLVKTIKPQTKIIYTESLTNPMLCVPDLPALASIAKEHGIQLIVDNTFIPIILTPCELGASVTVHSLTKFINGKSDGMGGAICGSTELIDSLVDVNFGTSMLLGPVLEPYRAASIHKNLFTLPIRMRQHSRNAHYLAERFEKIGMRTIYPGLASHPDHVRLTSIMNEGFGYGGMLALDLETPDRANKFLVAMQNRNLGYIAVSLGYYKTLFSNSGTSTSSEIPIGEQKKMGLSQGLVRISIGLDDDIDATWGDMQECLKSV